MGLLNRDNSPVVGKRQQDYRASVTVISTTSAPTKTDMLAARQAATTTVTVTTTQSVTVTEGGSTVTEPGSTITEPGSTVTEPGTTVTQPGSTVTVAAQTITQTETRTQSINNPNATLFSGGSSNPSCQDDLSWIAGPIVGGIVGLIIIGFLGSLWLQERKQRIEADRRAASLAAGVGAAPLQDKAELHSNPLPYELEGGRDGIRPELPGNDNNNPVEGRKSPAVENKSTDQKSREGEGEENG